MNYEKSCGAIVFHKNKVLVVKHNAGHISFPKGHVEKNESEIETAIREVKEETNIDIEIISDLRFPTFYQPKENTIKEVIFFVAKAINIDTIAQETEIESIEWLDINKVGQMLTHEDTKQLWKEVLIAVKNTNYF